MEKYAMEIQLIRDLLCAGLTGKSFEIGERKIDWQWVQKCLEGHQIVPIAWVGCKQVQDPERLPQPFQNALQHEYQMSAGWDTCQFFALEALKKAFREEKLDYMPLKGSILKQDYPNPVMRNMSDLDILFRVEQFSQVRPILEKAGCQFTLREAVDESYQMGPVVHIEAHWALLEGERPCAKYFHTIWQRAFCSDENPYEYRMTWEDYYLYMIAHAAKHFALCGTGLRSLTDLYVFWYQHGMEMDWNRVNTQLEALHLARFECMMRELQQTYFNRSAVMTKEQNEILEYMMRSGAYGNWKTGKVNQETIDSNKIDFASRWKTVFAVLFPSPKIIYEKYPFTAGKRYLLPAGWFFYMCAQLLHFPRSIRRFLQLIKLNKTCFERQKNLLRTVGLDHPL